MSRVIFQIGSCKTRKQTQIIKGFLNDEEVSWSDNSGRFISTQKDRVYRRTVWYMYEIDLQPQDVLKLEVKTYLTGVGIDTEKTFEVLYYVDESAPVKDVEMAGVGLKGYPIIKGRVLEIGSVSAEDKRKADIEDFMNEGF